MKPFTFKREARWLLLLAVLPPAIGMFIVIVWPLVARWLAP